MTGLIPELTVRAAAKINLHLGVGAPRPDGFHPLVTVFQAVGLCDDLLVARADDWHLSVRTASYLHAADIPVDDGNLVSRAAALLAAHHGRAATAAVVVDKSIPVAGGMAGGSADAAAALVALDRLWELETADDDLLRLAAELGSDVPFALVGGTALGTGRGEVLTPVPDPATWWWVIVPSDRGLSTPAVYRRFDELRPDAPAEPPAAGEVIRALASGQPEVLAPLLHNDLEAAALDLRPDLREVLAAGEAAGALRGMVSGSGPTCVFLCRSGEHARQVAGDLQGAGDPRGVDPRGVGHSVVLVANGPVAGAHVVEPG